MDRQAILDCLTDEVSGLRQRHGVRELGLFGSVARGDDREGSDLDFLVTFDGPATFDRFMGLLIDLEDLFGRRVDLGTLETLRPELRPSVERDLILVS